MIPGKEQDEEGRAGYNLVKYFTAWLLFLIVQERCLTSGLIKSRSAA